MRALPNPARGCRGRDARSRDRDIPRPRAGYATGIEAVSQLAIVALASAAYARRAATLRRRGRPVGRWRALAFCVGMAMTAAALSPPVDELADARYFWVP